jgi:hypothetical protein
MMRIEVAAPMTQRWSRAWVRALIAFFLVSRAGAEAEVAAASKRGYHLFHPAPDSLLRDLSADRPDLTESPYTVDPGRMQVETDLVRFSRDDAEGVRTETWTPLTLNLKLGLDHATDIQLVTEWHRFERMSAPGQPTQKREGFGDLVLRLKRNLVGNDEGIVSVALLPFVSFPTSTHGLGESSLGGGLALPVAADLGSGWGLGLMGEGDSVEDGDGDGRHLEWVATATTGHAIAGSLAGFIELAATFRPAEEGDWIGTVDGGLTYSVSRNAQLDAGVYSGISEDADDMTLFLGLTLRR